MWLLRVLPGCLMCCVFTLGLEGPSWRAPATSGLVEPPPASVAGCSDALKRLCCPTCPEECESCTAGECPCSDAMNRKCCPTCPTCPDKCAACTAGECSCSDAMNRKCCPVCPDKCAACSEGECPCTDKIKAKCCDACPNCPQCHGCPSDLCIECITSSCPVCISACHKALSATGALGPWCLSPLCLKCMNDNQCPPPCILLCTTDANMP